VNKQESSRKERKVPVPEDTRDAKSCYADIINLEHHVSAKRPRMDRPSRAAQFSPFAALTGYDDLIRESERGTDSRIELNEERKAQLNDRLARLLAAGPSPEAVFTYFVPDEKKEGGQYVSAAGRVVRFDQQSRSIILADGRTIPASEVISIDSDIFSEMD